jgi:CcmD family protein
VIPNAWGYVAAGYGITAVVLTSYVAWMFQRRRHLERVLSGEKDG